MRSPVRLLLAFGLLHVLPAGAQDFRGRVVDADTGLPLPGVNVTVRGTTLGGATSGEGMIVLSGLPEGRQTLVFTFIGFEDTRIQLTFPLENPLEIHEISMEEHHEELEEISVTATRTSRVIADQAVRVETIAGEEIEEKISMEPSNISMLLNESPGITVQQTSAVSGGASIRIQGLDGRYTQLLKDGFPLFGGFSGGLSLLQVPPLDLRQVEVIKGPSSTLYGGDAIAGLVNLVSRTPTGEPEWSVLTNATSAGGYDLGSFYAARGDRSGVTLLATGHRQKAYDADDDAFSNLPETRRVTLHPRLFLYPGPETTASVGLSATLEEREGGDLVRLAEGPSSGHTYRERSTSTRLSSQARLDHRRGDALLTVKNAVSFFDRTMRVPGQRFAGSQVATYSEVSVLADRVDHDVVAGMDVRTDQFREDAVTPRDYTYVSIGAFGQDTWDVGARTVIETGLRTEWHSEFGAFVLPRLSALYRISDGLSARVGGGLGYKAPTIFLEPSEERAFVAVRPLGEDVEAETSRGGSLDVNYNAVLFDRVVLSVNQALHHTNLRGALIPILEGPALRYRNAEENVRSTALETNLKLSLGDVKLFLGYVHLDARIGDEKLALTPVHKTYSVLVYEKHGTGRIGFEAYYTGPQRLEDGTKTSGFWITGVMAERRVGPVRAFLNFENFLDTKQSDYAPVVTGPRTNPRFAQIWAPMDGFIVNGGVKLQLR